MIGVHQRGTLRFQPSTQEMTNLEGSRSWTLDECFLRIDHALRTKFNTCLQVFKELPQSSAETSREPSKKVNRSGELLACN